jgi:hypothetical protein
MTEAEWLAREEPWRMLGIAQRQVNRRKFRLFACACCRRAPDAGTHDRGDAAIELAERLADGLETNQARAQAERELWLGPLAPRSRPPIFIYALKGNAVAAASDAAFWVSHNSAAERAMLCSLIRDIFGNPFRPVTFAPEWRTDTALTLARQMYESRDFSMMPILADALQDAGCDSDDVLAHCRGDGPHVRGCWVVDLVLGKQ